MKIGFLASSYPPESYSGIVQVAIVAEALAARGHECHVIVCRPKLPASIDEVINGVFVHRRPPPRLPTRGLARLPLIGRTVARHRAEDDPQNDLIGRLLVALGFYVAWRKLSLGLDVLEAPDSYLAGLLFALRRPLPLVVTLHGPPFDPYWHYMGSARTWRTRIIRQLKRTTERRATTVSTPSSPLIRELEEYGWLVPESARVVPNAVEQQWASAAPVETTRPVVLTVARLEPIVAHDVLLEAAAQLAPLVDGLEVICVGRSEDERDGMPYDAWLQKRARDLGAPLQLVEHVPRPELAVWYGRARVLAIPSLYEVAPMVGLEAMAAGRPVVCSWRTGYAALLAETGAGATFSPGDPTALANALLPYLQDVELAAAAGRRGRQLTTTVFSPAAVAMAREEAYAEAIRVYRTSGP